jgi:hypothetical protein
MGGWFFLRGRRVTMALFLPESSTVSNVLGCQPRSGEHRTRRRRRAGLLRHRHGRLLDRLRLLHEGQPDVHVGRHDGPRVEEQEGVSRVAMRIQSALSKILCLSAGLALVVACSGLNREGPDVSCNELQGGAVNACKDGIIASCKDGKTVTFEVCTNSDGDKACEASWQTKGAYTCTQGSSSGSGNSNTGTLACFGAQSSACSSCLRTTCPTDYGACVSDSTCSSRCTGPLAAALVPCIQQCKSACGSTSGGGPDAGGGGGGTSCSAGFLQCGSTCVPPANICDGHPDCADGSDESAANCTVPLQCLILLKCSQVSSADVAFFDYDANKTTIKTASVTAATTSPIAVPCTRRHKICFGAKSGNNIWGAYAPGTGQPSSTPDPSACTTCDENASCGGNLTCQ